MNKEKIANKFYGDLFTGKTDETLGYVYVLRSQYGYKIGKSLNPYKRFKNLQKQYGFDMEIENIYYCFNHHRSEKFLHDYFQEFNVSRHVGIGIEWFNFRREYLEVIESFMRPLDLIARMTYGVYNHGN